jgi:hypothetical protein
MPLDPAEPGKRMFGNTDKIDRFIPVLVVIPLFDDLKRIYEGMNVTGLAGIIKAQRKIA